MNTAEKLLEAIEIAATSPQVADSVGVNAGKWARAHFFKGVGSYIKGRNIGRLPYIALVMSSSDIERTTNDGGQETSGFTLRFYSRGKNSWDVTISNNKMIRNTLSVLQTNNHGINWEAQIGETTLTPWGGYTEVLFTTELTSPDFGYNDGECLE